MSLWQSPRLPSPLTLRIFSGVWRLIASHRILALFQSVPEVRPPSLRRRYPASTVLWTCPTPDRAATLSWRSEWRTPPDRASPDNSCCLASVLCPLPRRWVRLPVPSPLRAAFPVAQAGRHPHRYFRGLLRLYTLRPTGLLSRPQATFVTRLRPAQSPERTARQLLDQTGYYRGGIFLHWQHAPTGRTVQNRAARPDRVRKRRGVILRTR